MQRTGMSRRLRAARELASIGQGEAAEALGLPRTAVTQIEGGNRSVSTMELARFADLYRRPLGWFLADAPDADEDVVVALHRIAPGIDAAPETRLEVERCVQICREGVGLEGMLGRNGRDGPPAYREPVPRSTGEAVAQGERVAEQERRRLELGSAPIADMMELLGDRGIWASVVNLPHTMSGLFLNHPSIGMAVLVNAGHVRARQRFSLAHEYAHALVDRDRVVGVSDADSGRERIEQRANAFAAAFLLPKAGLDGELRRLGKGQQARTDQIVFDVATGGSIRGQLRPAARSQTIGFQDVAFIAHRFGVSYRVAVYRLKSLHHINRPVARALLSPEREATGKEYLSALDLFDDLEEPVGCMRGTRDLRSRVAHLALEAYRLEEISRGRLLDVSRTIGVDGRKLLELAEAARAE